MTPISLEITRERKQEGGESVEGKKGLRALIIFILPFSEIVSKRQKNARDTPAQTLRPGGIVFQNPVRYGVPLLGLPKSIY